MKANINVIERTVPFEFGGKTYQLKMTWNVEAEIVEKYGDIPLIFDGGAAMKNMMDVLAMLINEAVDIHNEENQADEWGHVEARYLGRHMDHNDAERISKAITEVVKNSRPQSDDEELTDDEKNEDPSR